MNVPVVSHLKLLVNLYNKMNNMFLVLLVIYLIIYLLSVLYKNKQIFCAILLSLLSWERGLKFIYAQRPDAVAVAPLVGAWIEIGSGVGSTGKSLSLLSWERGLKSIISTITTTLIRSLLSWERGLKYISSSTGVKTILSLLSWERGLKYRL